MDFAEKLLLVLFIIIAILLVVVATHGITNSRWEQWCINEGYAEYDKKTGELILYDKQYRYNALRKVLPGIFDNLLDKPLENGTM